MFWHRKKLYKANFNVFFLHCISLQLAAILVNFCVLMAMVVCMRSMYVMDKYSVCMAQMRMDVVSLSHTILSLVIGKRPSLWRQSTHKIAAECVARNWGHSEGHNVTHNGCHKMTAAKNMPTVFMKQWLFFHSYHNARI